MVEQSSEIDISGPDAPALSVSGAGPDRTETESRLADVLAEVVGSERVPVDSHFFTDLGANSLVMAQFCARARKRPDLPSPSMRDIYRYPTIRDLAEGLAPAAPPPDQAATRTTAPVAPAPAAPPAPLPDTSRLTHFLCGAFQLLAFLASSFVSGLVTGTGYEWVADGNGIADIYVRSLLFGGTGFIALCVFPVVAKWLLVGRAKPADFPVWGLAYLRFWLVKVLLHANPMVFLAGTPLYVLYLRALGARIGKGVTILSHTLPVCPDLVTIGAGTVIRKDSFILGYRAHRGRIQTGRITLGEGVFIGEKTTLDIDTAMGDGAQLGHASALHRGQAVPAGERWHGSPAEPTGTDYLRVPPARCGTLRRAWFGLGTLLQLVFVYIPLAVGGMYILFTAVPAIGDRLDPDTDDLAPGQLLTDALLLSLALFLGFILVGLVVLYTLPRLLRLVVRPDRVYPLYGARYALHRVTARLTNVKFYAWLFGDSSFVVHYLRGLGYNLSHVEQTGSNFGTEVQHETPLLVSVGSGTMVADGLSVLNADYSSTSFRLSQVSIGPRNFLGNNIAYPVGGRTGENCLLATKVMIPLDGEIRQGVGLLGSPCFEIPRSVDRDARFDHLREGEELSTRLRAKNHYNLRSMAWWLLARWLHVFVLTLFALATVDLYGMAGHVVIGAYLALTLAFSTAYYIVLERCMTRFRGLRPQLCSIYDRDFWRIERLWKVPSQWLNIFNGTPFKTLVWRLMGVRVGRMVFDDGCYITDRTLAVIGDGCTLNAGSKIQCHSQEDGTFKSDYIRLGAGTTLGVSAHVHYGVTMGEGSVLVSDSFLMKGEEVPPGARWGGNPAVEMPAADGAPGTPAPTASNANATAANVS
ncbi:peptide synthetase [Streptomyces sp. SID8366]|uniref:Pls/PosA family non-ribosomal peptide synthetase n=1 Tax=unclassified Streptomyces TaxID=2593676 RepID=UPI000DB90E4B|nr:MULTISPECIES: Pls/PosA family non-ribosomal peptide synthetase [unclassified Streptomyces]MYU04464.1 peptide synthetase [Streptomyces sp. SID8366]MYU64067.1 peptide synthetase [Streptomyces sp. SID69]RAJ54814.1 non-ribosomal peptide synthetase-like protein [Streptomyces sp. PsTaAH-130]